MSIILIGFMGAGKSTVARLLAEDFIDLDQLIEQKIEMPIAHFFALFGEKDFRRIENEVFESVLQNQAVIATGGGIVESLQNVEVLRSHSQVVFLSADFATLWERISADKVNVRPLAQDKAAAQRLFERRKKSYEAVADLTVDVTDKSPEAIVQLIKERWEMK